MTTWVPRNTVGEQQAAQKENGAESNQNVPSGTSSGNVDEDEALTSEQEEPVAGGMNQFGTKSLQSGFSADTAEVNTSSGEYMLDSYTDELHISPKLLRNLKGKLKNVPANSAPIKKQKKERRVLFK